MIYMAEEGMAGEGMPEEGKGVGVGDDVTGRNSVEGEAAIVEIVREVS